MSYEGWIRFGGNEIVNNERARGISRTVECPMTWLKGAPCDTLQDALGDLPYNAINLPSAPWYDLTMPDLTGRFFGVFALSVVGLNDSTRSASVVEGIDDGAQVGRTRKGSRQVRVRAILLARGRDALDYGVAWLSASLDPGACGQHGTGCGSTDLEFLTDCPPAREVEEADADYAARVEPYRRFLHGVTVTSGPLERELMNNGEFWGQVYEWTYTAGRPWVYSATRAVDLPVTPTIVIQDTPYNLVPYPSAELAGAEVDTAINYSLNPSLEANADGWTGDGSQVSGSVTTPFVTKGRVTGELQAAGNSSYRVRLLGDGTVASGEGVLRAMQTVDISGRPAGARVSLSVWAAAIATAGFDVTEINQLSATLRWLDSGGGVVGQVFPPTVSAPSDVSGYVFEVRSMLPPAGAVSARVELAAIFDWASGPSNTDIRLYTDALAVTVP